MITETFTHIECDALGAHAKADVRIEWLEDQPLIISSIRIHSIELQLPEERGDYTSGPLDVKDLISDAKKNEMRVNYIRQIKAIQEIEEGNNHGSI